MWPVRDTARVERDVIFIDTLSRHEISIAIVENFIGVDVRMIIGSWDRIRMVVEQPRDKGDFSKLRAAYPYNPKEAYFEVVEEKRDGHSWFYFEKATRKR